MNDFKNVYKRRLRSEREDGGREQDTRRERNIYLEIQLHSNMRRFERQIECQSNQFSAAIAGKVVAIV